MNVFIIPLSIDLASNFVGKSNIQFSIRELAYSNWQILAWLIEQLLCVPMKNVIYLDPFAFSYFFLYWFDCIPKSSS